MTRKIKNTREKLQDGSINRIKVLGFGKDDEAQALKAKYKPYSSVLLLQTFVTNFSITGMIVDGCGGGCASC